MTTSPAKRFASRPLELGLLLALAFFLPLYEAPKNLFWLGYVVVWAWNRWREGDWGGRWEGWDTLIALWLASGFVVAAFAGTHRSEWQGAADIVRYGTVLWCLRRGGYAAQDLQRLGVMLLASCAIGLAWGFWRYYGLVRRFVELNSVGHVNHSAPYIALCCGLALAWLLASWRRWAAWQRLAMATTMGFLLAGLIIGSSRAAIGAMVVGVLVLGAAWQRRSRLPLKLIAVSTVAVIALAIASDAAIVWKQNTNMQEGQYLSKRESIWRRAVVAWQIHPWFGVGIDNFGQITDDMVKRQVEASGKPYVREDYAGPNHAHNLYLNTLAERGLFGFAVFAAVLAAWAAALWRQRPAAQAPDIVWTYWGAAIAAWVVIAGAGLLNTTLHHEIAILAMMILGGWMALRRLPG